MQGYTHATSRTANCCDDVNRRVGYKDVMSTCFTLGIVCLGLWTCGVTILNDYAVAS